jgi:hypothetical protein
MSEIATYGEANARIARLGLESGLEETVLGLFSCALGAIYLPALELQRARLFGQHYAMIAPYVQMLCCLAMAVALKTLRAKLVFPRTGYAVFRPPMPQIIWMMVVSCGMIVAIALTAMFWRSSLNETGLDDVGRLAGPAIALVMAGCFVSMSITSRFPRFIWLGGWALVVGTAAYYLAPGIEGGCWELIGIGMAMALSGAVRLKRFLKTHPVIEAHHD